MTVVKPFSASMVHLPGAATNVSSFLAVPDCPIVRSSNILQCSAFCGAKYPPCVMNTSVSISTIVNGSRAVCGPREKWDNYNLGWCRLGCGIRTSNAPPFPTTITASINGTIGVPIDVAGFKTRVQSQGFNDFSYLGGSVYNNGTTVCAALVKYGGNAFTLQSEACLYGNSFWTAPSSVNGASALRLCTIPGIYDAWNTKSSSSSSSASSGSTRGLRSLRDQRDIHDIRGKDSTDDLRQTGGTGRTGGFDGSIDGTQHEAMHRSLASAPSQDVVTTPGTSGVVGTHGGHSWADGSGTPHIYMFAADNRPDNRRLAAATAVSADCTDFFNCVSYTKQSRKKCVLLTSSANWRDSVTENAPGVGGHGGSCTCPNGKVYQTGDNNDNCGSLACVGGVSGTCNSKGGPWSRRKVVCAAPSYTSLSSAKTACTATSLCSGIYNYGCVSEIPGGAVCNTSIVGACAEFKLCKSSFFSSSSRSCVYEKMHSSLSYEKMRSSVCTRTLGRRCIRGDAVCTRTRRCKAPIQSNANNAYSSGLPWSLSIATSAAATEAAVKEIGSIPTVILITATAVIGYLLLFTLSITLRKNERNVIWRLAAADWAPPTMRVNWANLLHLFSILLETAQLCALILFYGLPTSTKGPLGILRDTAPRLLLFSGNDAGNGILVFAICLVALWVFTAAAPHVIKDEATRDNLGA